MTLNSKIKWCVEKVKDVWLTVRHPLLAARKKQMDWHMKKMTTDPKYIADVLEKRSVVYRPIQPGKIVHATIVLVISIFMFSIMKDTIAEVVPTIENSLVNTSMSVVPYFFLLGVILFIVSSIYSELKASGIIK